MRILNKTTKPAILTEKAEEWTTTLLDVLERGEKPSDALKGRYRHPEIKNALIAETDGKCAYCESKIRHVSPGDIEHIIPKSRVPSEAYNWQNLTLACSECNNRKGDHYSEDDEGLVDPYADDPAQYFLFFKEVISPRPDRPRAMITEQVINLSRNELIERRRERMQFLDGIVSAYSFAAETVKPVILINLRQHLASDREYVSTSRAYIEDLKRHGVLPSEFNY